MLSPKFLDMVSSYELSVDQSMMFEECMKLNTFLKAKEENFHQVKSDEKWVGFFFFHYENCTNFFKVVSFVFSVSQCYKCSRKNTSSYEKLLASWEEPFVNGKVEAELCHFRHLRDTEEGMKLLESTNKVRILLLYACLLKMFIVLWRLKLFCVNS